ncbi:MAG TPA: hypothetical protein VFP92_08405 [Rhodanobacteraceae bacterium]|nr:hypothetical protein [Rhodanobacteraceae bacterium]
MRRSGWIAVPVLLVCCVAPPVAHAQTHTGVDDLGQCLIRSTTPADRKVLAQWAFATMALDPDVAPLAAITPAQRDAINRKTGGVVTTLLADSCRVQAQQALANGGTAAVETAFEAWGRWAVTGLVSQPQVMQGMGGLLQYIDIGKLMGLMPLQGLPPAGSGR